MDNAENTIETTNEVETMGNIESTQEEIIDIVNNETVEETQEVFTIPEQYKSKNWAKNIKSLDDLYKSYDNAQSLIGKKTIGIPDFEKASEEEIKSFYDKLTPKTIEDYEFSEEMTQEEKEFYGNLFKDNGVNKKSAQAMISTFKNYLNSFYDNDAFIGELKDRFGTDYKERVNDTTKVLQKYFPKEDQKILDNLPNKMLCAMLQFADNVKQGYGIEMQSHADNKTIDNVGYTKADYENLVNEMLNLDSQNKLTPALKKDYLNKMDKMVKTIKW